MGEGQGSVTFQVFDDAPATNRMASLSELSENNLAGTQTVASVSLDDYCVDQNIEKIAFLKIDVEGMEPYVLRGAKTLLQHRKISAVLIEICPLNLHTVGFSCADLYREVEAVRYSPYILNSNGTPGSRLSLNEIEAMSLDNIVLLPDD